MVDDRALRLRQGGRQPRPTPSFVQPEPNALDFLAGNFARYSQDRADDIVKYGGATSGLGSRTADLLVNQGVSDNLGLRAAALAGDIVLDPAILIPGVGAVKGAQTAGRVANLAPAPRQAYLNSLMGRLYHGSKSTEPFVVQRSAGNPDNLFGADFFTTTNRALAETPGYGAGRAHKVRLPLADAENLRVLDLMPGAPTVRDQFPGLADLMERLNRSNLSIGGSAATTADPVALQQAVNAVGRHIPFTRSFSDKALVSPDNIHGFMDWGKVLRDQGINAVRHESGRLVPDAEAVAPVIAFLDPPPMRATPSINFDRLMENVSDAIRYAPQNIGSRFSSLLNRLRVGRQPAYNPLIDEL